MTTFNIYGSCICRDLFAFTENEDFLVQHFSQYSSPAVHFLYKEKPVRQMLWDDVKDIAIVDFQKKCIMRDFNKTLLEFFEKPADFFVIDLVAMMHTHLYKGTDPDGNTISFSNSSALVNAMKGGLNEFFKGYELTEYKPVDFMTDEETEYIINEYVKWITEEKGYREDQIILIENKSVQYYSDGRSLARFNYNY